MTNCDIRIWHTLAEVKLFVFLFVIKLFLNCCCSIDVLCCFAIFFFYYFAICSLCIKKSLFAVMFADVVTGIGIIDAFLGGNVTLKYTRYCF